MQNYWNLYLACKQQELYGPLIIGTFEKRAPGSLLGIYGEQWGYRKENQVKQEGDWGGKGVPTALLPFPQSLACFTLI